MNWKEAFLLQSKSDFKVFLHLNSCQMDLCHQLHYFQMATEKLSKSYRLTKSSPPPKRVHSGFVDFLRVCKKVSAIRRFLGYKNESAFSAFIKSLEPLAQRIEDLAPVGGTEKPNPEYPWEDAAGLVQSPLHFNFPGLSFDSNNAKMINLKNLVNNLLCFVAE